MALEAPSTGPIAATPSNFGNVIAQRAASADPTTGLYQPSAGGSDLPRANAWGEPPKAATQAPVANGNGGTDPSVTQRRYGGESMPQTGEHGQAVGEGQEGSDPSQLPSDLDPAEQLYDPDTGEPIDMQAYHAQRAEVLQRIQQHLEDGKFPYEDMKNLPIDLPGPNGETRQVTIEELRSNGMRAADYTRKLNDVYQLRNQALNILQLERARNTEWRDPNMLRQGLMMLGLGESLEKMVFSIAQERVNYLKLPPSERALHDQLQAERMEKARLFEQHRQNQLRAQQMQGPDQATMHVAKQIEQLMPRALRHAGVGQYPLSQQYFVNNLSVLCADGEVTPERAIQAAQATKQMLEELAQFNQQRGGGNQQAHRPMQPPDPFEPQNPGTRSAYPLSPRRLATGSRPQLMLGNLAAGGGGGAPNGNGRPAQAGRRPSDFARRFG